MAENSLLGKLDGLVSRFEEVGTLITDQIGRASCRERV